MKVVLEIETKLIKLSKIITVRYIGENNRSIK